MAAVDFSIHALNPALSASVPALQVAAPASDPDDGFSFDDLIDMVNPLQHIPVVGTIYRALTGDKMNTAPKILGDTLYGGPTGFVGSVADTIFEKVTGKNFGDTILGFVEDIFTPDKAETGVADATPATLTAPQNMPVPSTNLVAYVPALPSNDTPVQVQPASQDAIVVPGQDELLMALSRSGIGQDVALRAADAYRRTLNVAGTAQANALQ